MMEEERIISKNESKASLKDGVHSNINLVSVSQASQANIFIYSVSWGNDGLQSWTNVNCDRNGNLTSSYSYFNDFYFCCYQFGLEESLTSHELGFAIGDYRRSDAASFLLGFCKTDCFSLLSLYLLDQSFFNKGGESQLLFPIGPRLIQVIDDATKPFPNFGSKRDGGPSFSKQLTEITSVQSFLLLSTFSQPDSQFFSSLQHRGVR